MVFSWISVRLLFLLVWRCLVYVFVLLFHTWPVQKLRRQFFFSPLLPMFPEDVNAIYLSHVLKVNVTRVISIQRFPGGSFGLMAKIRFGMMVKKKTKHDDDDDQEEEEEEEEEEEGCVVWKSLMNNAKVLFICTVFGPVYYHEWAILKYFSPHLHTSLSPPQHHHHHSSLHPTSTAHSDTHFAPSYSLLRSNTNKTQIHPDFFLPLCFDARMSLVTCECCFLMEDLSHMHGGHTPPLGTDIHTLRRILQTSAHFRRRTFRTHPMMPPEVSLRMMSPAHETSMLIVYPLLWKKVQRLSVPFPERWALQVTKDEYFVQLINCVFSQLSSCIAFWNRLHLHHLHRFPGFAHLDPRLDNFFFTPNEESGRNVLIDFQGCGPSSPGMEVSWSMVSELSIQDRRCHEVSLLQHYWDQLKHDVTNLTFDDLLLEYRLGIIWVAFVAGVLVVSSVEMSEENPKVAQMLDRAVPRMLAAIRDHNCLQLAKNLFENSKL